MNLTRQILKQSDWAVYYRPILRLGIPIAIGQIGVIAMGFADTIMVGHVDTTSLAAASFVNSVFNVVTYLLLGYSYGLTPLISSLTGRNERGAAGETFKSGLLCNLIFSLILMLILGAGYFFLGRMGQPGEILPLVRPYYLTLWASVFFMAMFNAFRQFTDGISETATGMWVILGGNLLNVIGNALLIFGLFGLPRLGLLGAGLSTLFARIVMALVMAGLFVGRKKYAAYRRGFANEPMRRASLRKLHRQSCPIALQMGMESGVFTVSGIMAGWLGALSLAAYQVIITMSGLGFMLYYSFGAGITIRVAHFMGLNDIHGVRKTGRAGMRILLVMAALSSMLFYFGGEAMIRCFTPDDAVIALAVSLLPPLVLYQLGDSMQICFANALRGTSYVMPMMWIALVSYVLINLPASYLMAFPLGLGIQGLFYAFSVGLFTAAVLFAYYFYKAVRQHNNKITPNMS